MNDNDLMRERITFARSISERNLHLIGFIDTKTTIVVGINGVLLGLLFGSNIINLMPEEPAVRYLFILVVSLLGASAVFGLVTIIPRIVRNMRYRGSMTFHESILHSNISDDVQHRISDWWRLKGRKASDVNAYQEFERRWIDMSAVRILKEEVINAYRLAGALGHQFLWVRLSLAFLISAVISIIMSIQIATTKSVIEECGERPDLFGVNETNLRKCSMFTEGSLAKLCAMNPQRFDMTKVGCSRFIPASG